MIKAWTDNVEAGRLARAGRGTAFSYLPDAQGSRAVSVTMPVRVASWNTPFGLLPIFDMNMPEGMLRERLRLTFAKATGSFDDLDLLLIVGRSQVGRIRYSGVEESLREDVPFQAVEEILSSRQGGGDLFRYLIERFAEYSGISGVQPKVLVRDEGASAMLNKSRASHSHRGATHIVKFWEVHEFPQLAANEHFCLQAAKRCGLQVPPCRLAEDGSSLVVDRFDLRPDGTYRGFEDFAVLNARRTEEKYRGSYETNVLRRFEEFTLSTEVVADLERLFTLIVLNCTLRNGDAHLKNFGVLYDDVLGEARLAPVFDVVTTAAYLPDDTLALTLNGTVQWPLAPALRRIGETRAHASPARVRHILQSVSAAVSDTMPDVKTYMKEHPEFSAVGGRMLEAWEAGLRSLRTA